MDRTPPHERTRFSSVCGDCRRALDAYAARSRRTGLLLCSACARAEAEALFRACP